MYLIHFYKGYATMLIISLIMIFDMIVIESMLNVESINHKVKCNNLVGNTRKKKLFKQLIQTTYSFYLLHNITFG